MSNKPPNSIFRLHHGVQFRFENYYFVLDHSVLSIVGPLFSDRIYSPVYLVSSWTEARMQILERYACDGNCEAQIIWAPLILMATCFSFTV